jgi:hypothetical protein
MKRSIIAVVLLSLVLFSCKRNNKEAIIGKWHAVKLENPEMDSFFIKSQIYIDTIGKGHDAATNIQLYGVANMDSMRHILQGQYDSAKTMQDAAVNNTIFNFRKDSVVILSFNGSVDSSKWYFDASGSLVLAELNGYGPGDKIKMELVALSDTVLKLKFIENTSVSTVTFHPEAK